MHEYGVEVNLHNNQSTQKIQAESKSMCYVI